MSLAKNMFTRKVMPLIMLLAAISLSAVSSAQDDPPGPGQAPLSPLTASADSKAPERENIERVDMNGRMSLDLRNIEIVEALKFFAMKAGLSIVSTKNVAGRVTLM